MFFMFFICKLMFYHLWSTLNYLSYRNSVLWENFKRNNADNVFARLQQLHYITLPRDNSQTPLNLHEHCCTTCCQHVCVVEFGSNGFAQ